MTAIMLTPTLPGLTDLLPTKGGSIAPDSFSPVLASLLAEPAVDAPILPVGTSVPPGGEKLPAAFMPAIGGAGPRPTAQLTPAGAATSDPVATRSDPSNPDAPRPVDLHGVAEPATASADTVLQALQASPAPPIEPVPTTPMAKPVRFDRVRGAAPDGSTPPPASPMPTARPDATVPRLAPARPDRAAPTVASPEAASPALDLRAAPQPVTLPTSEPRITVRIKAPSTLTAVPATAQLPVTPARLDGKTTTAPPSSIDTQPASPQRTPPLVAMPAPVPVTVDARAEPLDRPDPIDPPGSPPLQSGGQERITARPVALPATPRPLSPDDETPPGATLSLDEPNDDARPDDQPTGPPPALADVPTTSVVPLPLTAVAPAPAAIEATPTVITAVIAASAPRATGTSPVPTGGKDIPLAQSRTADIPAQSTQPNAAAAPGPDRAPPVPRPAVTDAPHAIDTQPTPSSARTPAQAVASEQSAPPVESAMHQPRPAAASATSPVGDLTRVAAPGISGPQPADAIAPATAPAAVRPAVAVALQAAVPMPVAPAQARSMPPARVAAAPEHEQPSPEPAPAPSRVEQPAPVPPASVLPAFQVFGAALHRAAVAERRPVAITLTARDGELQAVVAPAPIAPLPDQPPVDTTQPHWPEAMISRIERLRDELAAPGTMADTRIRLHPDALGPIDVTLRRDGDAVQVQLRSAEPATLALLAEAQPRLHELAESRGLRLTNTDIGGNTQDQPGDRRQPPAAPTPTQPSPRRPANDTAAADDLTDTRLA